MRSRIAGIVIQLICEECGQLMSAKKEGDIITASCCCGNLRQVAVAPKVSLMTTLRGQQDA